MYKFTLERDGKLDGVVYWQIIHNGHVIDSRTKSSINELIELDLMDAVIDEFYFLNPHLSKEV